MERIFDIYTRVSRVKGRDGDSYGSPEIQEAVCRTWASANGFEVGGVVLEEDVSGSTPVADRGLESLVRRVERGETAGILTAHLDRFGRSVIEGALAYKRIADAGGRLVCASDGIDSSRPGDKLVFNLRMAIAEDYLDRIRANWRAITGRAVERGVYVYKTPLGYHRLEDGRIEPDPVTGPLVREAFRRRAAGARLSEIVGLFEDAGVSLSKSGAGWLLKRRAYLGEMEVPTEVKGETRTVTNHHPPLVTETEWEAANAAASAYSPRDGSIAAKASLSGLVYCGTCGSRLRVGAYGRPGARKPQYVCTARGCTAHACIRAETLNAYVRHVAADALLQREPHVAAIMEGDDAYQRALEAVSEASAALAEYRDNIAIQRELGTDLFAEGLKVRKAGLEEARRALSEIRPPKREGTRDGKRRMMSWQEYLEHEDERAFFRRFVARVAVRPIGRGRRGDVGARVDVYFIGAGEPYRPAEVPRDKEIERQLAAAHAG